MKEGERRERKEREILEVINKNIDYNSNADSNRQPEGISVREKGVSK